LENFSATKKQRDSHGADSSFGQDLDIAYIYVLLEAKLRKPKNSRKFIIELF
jgi:hypothetical protein